MEVLFVIVCGVATDAEVINQFADLFRLRFRPIEIRAVKFNALVSELGDCAHCAFEVLLEGLSNGIQLETNRDVGCLALDFQRPWQHCGENDKRPASESHAGDSTPSRTRNFTLMFRRCPLFPRFFARLGRDINLGGARECESTTPPS